MNATTARLAEMLASEATIEDSELTQRANSIIANMASAAANSRRVEAALLVTARASGFIEGEDWARNNPHLCTGRGPTGRLRNFRAMNPDKLATTWGAVYFEGNDPEALTALAAELDAREIEHS